MPWEVALVASLAIAVPYMAISWLIASGLATSGQLKSNRLGLATALIFFSCGMGHLLMAAHLFEGAPVREAVDTHIVVWDIWTAAIAIWYLSLRGRYSQLLEGRTSMFEDPNRIAAEAQAHHDAYHDHLTGLPNRPALVDAATVALDPAIDNGQRALFFIDLDCFKDINDRLGHVAGDALIVAAAERLKRAVRPSDTVARFGGDEFIVLLGGDTSSEQAMLAAARLADSLREPFSIAGETVALTCSVGIALARSGEANAAQLLHRADEAMYAAKANGRARYEIYSPATPVAGEFGYSLNTA